MSDNHKFSLKHLLSQLPVDAPVDLAWLNAHQVQSNYAARLARSGYLRKLGAGVYCAPAAKLQRDACLVWLMERVPGLHVASKTALAWRGIRHNIATREMLVLWGEQQFKVPAWFSEMFPVRHHTTHIFDAQLEPLYALTSAPGKPTEIIVSSPERAILEMLSEVGTHVSLEEARNITENARNLRRDVLEHLFSHLTRVKVIRLAESLAREQNLPWLDLTQTHLARMDIKGRWVLSRTSSLENFSLNSPRKNNH